VEPHAFAQGKGKALVSTALWTIHGICNRARQNRGSTAAWTRGSRIGRANARTMRSFLHPRPACCIFRGPRQQQRGSTPL